VGDRGSAWEIVSIREFVGLPARAPPLAPATSSDTSVRSPEPYRSWDYDQTLSADDP